MSSPRPLRLRAMTVSRVLGGFYLAFGLVFGAAGFTAMGGESGGPVAAVTMCAFGTIMVGIGLRLLTAAVVVNVEGVRYRRLLARRTVPRSDILRVEVETNNAMFRSQEALVLVTADDRIPLTLLAAYKTQRGRAWLAAKRAAIEAALSNS